MGVEAVQIVALPEIDPILPQLSKHVPRGKEWVYELKLDGFRGTLYVEKGRGYFRSKTRRPMARFQELADRLAASLDVRSAILDGEIIVLTKGVPDFRALLLRKGEPEFAAFDLMWLNGRDLRASVYWRRKKSLQNLLAKHPIIAFVESHAAPGLFEAAAQLDLEGIVAKRRSDPYDPAVARWVKVKYAEYSQNNEERWEMFERRR